MLGYDRVLVDDAGNIVGILFGREQGQTLLLNSHMDTVAAGNEEQWTVPPHAGLLHDGRLYGRGASDCKGGLAAQIYAGCLLKRSLLPMRGNVVVAATVAEENGRSVGVRNLIRSTLPGPVCIPIWRSWASQPAWESITGTMAGWKSRSRSRDPIRFMWTMRPTPCFANSWRCETDRFLAARAARGHRGLRPGV